MHTLLSIAAVRPEDRSRNSAISGDFCEGLTILFSFDDVVITTQVVNVH